MAVKRILQLGNPLLVKKSSPVRFPLNDEVKTIILDLSDTLEQFRIENDYGDGIAACQIGSLRRLIYIIMPTGEFTGVMINPEFIFQSEQVREVWDDCFTFPGMLVRVPRSEVITVSYQNEIGEKKTIEATGRFAALLQHEIDHLDSVLAIHLGLSVDALMTRDEWIRIGRPE